ncbi:MAG: anaerobic ribonucleoside-triphosphate reductase activating protein [Bacillaceae bacterium]
MNILHDSVVDGEGLRTVVFFAGCPHQCIGCHNQQSWNIKNGTKMTIEDVLEEIKKNSLTDVTFSGGEPFMQAKEVKELAKEVKKLNKDLWIYTGYTLEYIKEYGSSDMKELLSYGDVLVDGLFIQEERDLTLPFRGSRNQRIHYLNEMKNSLY